MDFLCENKIRRQRVFCCAFSTFVEQEFLAYTSFVLFVRKRNSFKCFDFVQFFSYFCRIFVRELSEPSFQDIKIDELNLLCKWNMLCLWSVPIFSTRRKYKIEWNARMDLSYSRFVSSRIHYFIYHSFFHRSARSDFMSYSKTKSFFTISQDIKLSWRYFVFSHSVFSEEKTVSPFSSRWLHLTEWIECFWLSVYARDVKWMKNAILNLIFWNWLTHWICHWQLNTVNNIECLASRAAWKKEVKFDLSTPCFEFKQWRNFISQFVSSSLNVFFASTISIVFSSDWISILMNFIWIDSVSIFPFLLQFYLI